MLDKLKSRKFWVAVVAGALVILNEGLEMNLPGETIQAFAAIIIGYLVGQGAADAAASLKK